MKDIIRDSTVGQLINWASDGLYLPYPDQRSDYTIPARFDLPSSVYKARIASIEIYSSARATSPAFSSVQGSEKGEIKNATLAYDPYLVGWNGDDDPDNPRYPYTLAPLLISFLKLLSSNWSFGKRAFTTFSISFLTFGVYIGSAIYTAAIPDLMEAFDISLTNATLGLTLYILGEISCDLVSFIHR
jgi:DHA1 family multidrug resistance protein-like MFS transporter